MATVELHVYGVSVYFRLILSLSILYLSWLSTVFFWPESRNGRLSATRFSHQNNTVDNRLNTRRLSKTCPILRDSLTMLLLFLDTVTPRTYWRRQAGEISSNHIRCSSPKLSAPSPVSSRYRQTNPRKGSNSCNSQLTLQPDQPKKRLKLVSQRVASQLTLPPDLSKKQGSYVKTSSRSTQATARSI